MGMTCDGGNVFWDCAGDASSESCICLVGKHMTRDAKCEMHWG